MTSILTHLTEESQLRLPPILQKALGIAPGHYVSLTVAEGGVLIRPVTVAPGREGEVACMEMVQAIGEQLEAEGITEKEQLDDEIKALQRESYEQRYSQRYT